MARLASLTPQQVRVLMMLSEGLLNKQIAYELSVSEATVKAHVSAILQKLGVESRTQAVIAASKIELGQWPQTAGRRADWSRYSAAATRCIAPLREQRAQGRRLERLVEHLDGVRAGILAHMRAAVGGDQDGGEVGAEAPAQFGDRIDAIALVEMVVDQQAVRRDLGFRNDRDCRRRDPGALKTRQPQPPSSVSMPSRMARSLSMHRTVMPDSCTRSTSRATRWCWLTGMAAASGTSTENRDPRPTVEVTATL